MAVIHTDQASEVTKMVPKARASSRLAGTSGRRRTMSATIRNTSGQARKTVPWMDSDQKCCSGIGAPP